MHANPKQTGSTLNNITQVVFLQAQLHS